MGPSLDISHHRAARRTGGNSLSQGRSNGERGPRIEDRRNTPAGAGVGSVGVLSGERNKRSSRPEREQRVGSRREIGSAAIGGGISPLRRPAGFHQPEGTRARASKRRDIARGGGSSLSAPDLCARSRAAPDSYRDR